jgi:PKD repeat protein
MVKKGRPKMVRRIPTNVGIGLTILLLAVIILFFARSVVDLSNGDGHAPDIVQDSVKNNEENTGFSSLPSPLTAEASANPNSGQAPLKVNFTGSAIGGTPPHIFEWDFDYDDVTDAREKNTSHIFSDSQADTRQVTLTVTDAEGTAATDTVTIDIIPTNLSYPADLTIKIEDISYLELRDTTKGVSFLVRVINRKPVDVEAVRVVINIYRWQSPFNSSIVWHREVYDDMISVPKAKGFWGYYYAARTIPLTVSDLDVGVYTLQAYVNPSASVPETDYRDNSAERSFEVSCRPALPSVWVCRQW